MDDMQNPGSAPETQAPMTPPPAPEPMPAPQAAPAPQEAPMQQSAPAPSASPLAPSAAPHNGERRGMAAVSYLGVFCLIPLIFAKDSAFAQYHAKQGVILAIVGVILNFASGFLWDLPFGGALSSIVGLALFIVSVMGIAKALKGEKFEIPYISEWAAKIHF